MPSGWALPGAAHLRAIITSQKSTGSIAQYFSHVLVAHSTRAGVKQGSGKSPSREDGTLA